MFDNIATLEFQTLNYDQENCAKGSPFPFGLIYIKTCQVGGLPIHNTLVLENVT